MRVGEKKQSRARTGEAVQPRGRPAFLLCVLVCLVCVCAPACARVSRERGLGSCRTTPSIRRAIDLWCAWVTKDIHLQASSSATRSETTRSRSCASRSRRPRRRCPRGPSSTPRASDVPTPARLLISPQPRTDGPRRLPPPSSSRASNCHRIASP